jgi:cytochrome c biogenesis protein CcdA
MMKGRSMVAALLVFAATAVDVSAQEPPVPVVIEYYTLVGCHDCEEYEAGTLKTLRSRLQSEGHEVSVVSYDVLERESFERLQARLRAAGRKYGGTPVVIAGSTVLQGNELEEDAALVLILEGLKRGSTNGTSEPEPAQDGKAIRKGLSVPIILVAGLVDGVNPCALTVLVFLLSSLALSRAEKGTVLRIGLGFAAGVFSAYTLTGFGLLGVADALRGNRAASETLRIATVALLWVMAALSVRDAVLLGRGKSADVALRMPVSFTRAVHALIRNRRNSAAVGLAAFFGAATLGAAVSMLEFVCTGQVYLPTLVYIARTAPAEGSVLLLLYNLAFMVPILVVLGLIFFGLSQVRLAELVKDRAVAVKVGTACLFLFLSFVLIFS